MLHAYHNNPKIKSLYTAAVSAARAVIAAYVRMAEKLLALIDESVRK